MNQLRLSDLDTKVLLIYIHPLLPKTYQEELGYIFIRTHPIPKYTGIMEVVSRFEMNGLPPSLCTTLFLYKSHNTNTYTGIFQSRFVLCFPNTVTCWHPHAAVIARPLKGRG